MTRVALCAAVALLTTGCGLIQRTTVSTPPAACSKVVPQGWKQPVDGAPVPQMDSRIDSWIGKPLTDAMVVAITGPWAQGYIRAEGQLQKANGRTLDAIGIVERCEALVNAARADAN